MLGALALGIISGLWMPEAVSKLAFIPTIFAHAVKMVVMPIILLSVTLGAHRTASQHAKLGRTALLSICFFIAATVFAAGLGLCLDALFRPGLDAHLVQTAAMPKSLAAGVNWTQFIVDLIPANVVASLAADNALPVLVFGALLGSALAATGEAAAPMVRVIESLNAALFKMVEWVVALSPLAIFSAIATLLASKGLHALLPLVKLLGVAYLGLALLALVLTGIIRAAGYSPRDVIKHVSQPLILAFTTRSSEITFPIHLQKLTEMGVPQPIVATILPLSYVFNRDGAVLYTALVVGYLMDVYHVAWSWHLALTIIVLSVLMIDGAASVPSGAVVAITVILSAVGLPIEAITLILGVDAFFDMGRTALNVYSSTSAAAVATKFTSSGTVDRAGTVSRGALTMTEPDVDRVQAPIR
jgi:DAACS family dicarboxylate/amino acid:cation (Na+ or H+) symporter